MSNAKSTNEDWAWADALLAISDWSDFDVDTCEFNTETGDHVYFNEFGAAVLVTPTGDVLIDGSGCE